MSESTAWETFYAVVAIVAFVALCIYLARPYRPCGKTEADEMSEQPQGVRNNNPLNLRSGGKYEGLAIPAMANGFLNFTLAMWGFRAAFRNYITKADKGIDTIRVLLTEWSPPSDNISASDPDGTKQLAGYIAEVCKRSGFGPDEKIDLKKWAVASQICYAQTVVECGGFDQYFKKADMEQGAFRAGIVDAPAPLTHKVASAVLSTGGTGVILANALAPHVDAAAAATPTGQIVHWVLVGVSIVIVLYIGYLRQHVKEAS